MPFDTIAGQVKQDQLKRKRGRPRKDASSVTNPLGTPSPSSTPGNGFANPATSTLPGGLDLPQTKEAIKPLIKHGSEYLASKYEWQGFKCDDAETEMLSANAEIVLKTITPMLGNSPYTPAIVAGVTIIGFGGFKYLGYRAYLKEKALQRAS